MRRWYDWLESRRVYGLFLRHRARARRNVLEIGLFGLLSMYFLLIVWLFPPLVLLSVLAAMFIGHAVLVVAGIWAVLVLIYFIMFFPFASRTFSIAWDTLGLGAWSAISPRHNKYVKIQNDIAQEELALWNHKYA